MSLFSISCPELLIIYPYYLSTRFIRSIFLLFLCLESWFVQPLEIGVGASENYTQYPISDNHSHKPCIASWRFLTIYKRFVCLMVSKVGCVDTGLKTRYESSELDYISECLECLPGRVRRFSTVK